MNLTTDRSQNVSIVRVNETRLMYPILSEFASTITSLIGSGDNRLLLDLSTVTYVDSATTTGADIPLDGDLLAIMETLYREVTARRDLERSFEDMVREINHLIEQMDDGERRAYLLESLFLNTVKYENDKLEAYMRRIAR